MATYDSFLFAGHGKSEKDGSYDPGAIQGSAKENYIANLIITAALKYIPTDLKIHRDECNMKDKDLANNTYKRRAGLIVHLNKGGGMGPEVFIPLGERNMGADAQLCADIATILGKNRGVKSRYQSDGKTVTRINGAALHGTDYYGEIRDAYNRGISASLVEIGFLDSSDLPNIQANIDKIGYFVAKWIVKVCGGTLKAFGAEEVPKPKPVPSDTYYRVIVGSYKDRSNAEAQIKQLKSKGFDSFLEVFKEEVK